MSFWRAQFSVFPFLCLFSSYYYYYSVSNSSLSMIVCLFLLQGNECLASNNVATFSNRKRKNKKEIVLFEKVRIYL